MPALRQLITVLFILCAPSLWAFDHTHAEFTTLLKQHVKEGNVDYAAWVKDPSRLKTYLGTMAKVPQAEFKTWTKPQQLAWLINFYNASTIQLILAHYPLKSIKDIPGPEDSPWKRLDLTLFGAKTSLDALENEVIRPTYHEPRVHFALVCAAIGCPPLRGEAFVAERLKAQMEEQATLFLATKTKNRVEGSTLYLSPIFDWYAEDFKANGGSVSTFVAGLFPKADRPAIIKGLTIKFTEYDWNLNKS
jgi:hypothetical protein